ncbi:MAG: VRR-NUC domain-containing protein [Bacteroidales bacterium]|jgi:hypothetical protein|nr:VRR-NUC domain-containing protein [Bacteroidales bacterium]
MTTESKKQIRVIQWAKRQRSTCPEIRWLHHIPNGGARNIAVASKLKLEGVESGVLDLFLPVKRHGNSGLYIEMKNGKSKLSQNQKEFKEFVINQGFAAVTARSSDEGISFLRKYLGI